MRLSSLPHSKPARSASVAALTLAAFALVVGACSSGSTSDAAENDSNTSQADNTDNSDTADNTETSGAAASDNSAANGELSEDVVGDSTSSANASSEYLGSYSLTDDEFGTVVTVTVDGTTRIIEANALPDHDTGEFPNAGNPNTITEQNVSYSYTTEPTFIGAESATRTTGVAVNGVKFEPGTAETVSCSSGETLRVEALQDVYNLGLDFNNAHVQPTGEYHYHGVSDMLVDAYATSDDLVHVGFAADGYLMYYSKSGAYEPSYVLATDARVGTDCTASGPAGGTAVGIEGSSPDGTYTSDYVFDASSGDLDACNGVVIDGEYAYIITDAYPFVGRCLNGEASSESAPGQGAAPTGDAAPVSPTEGAGPEGGQPDLTEAAAALGVTQAELQAALGGPPPDFEAAADALGVSLDELMAAVPGPPNQG